MSQRQDRTAVCLLADLDTVGLQLSERVLLGAWKTPATRDVVRQSDPVHGIILVHFLP